ncbi:hypothetical protein B0H13DRAFT_2556241 [Mycena leptocephala]|nr:hypothetical protein B0H13DRAFT_2556241 [Mycena leptocephala]
MSSHPRRSRTSHFSQLLVDTQQKRCLPPFPALLLTLYPAQYSELFHASLQCIRPAHDTLTSITPTPPPTCAMHLRMSDSVILVRSFAARLFISVISCGIHSPSDISTSLPSFHLRAHLKQQKCFGVASAGSSCTSHPVCYPTPASPARRRTAPTLDSMTAHTTPTGALPLLAAHVYQRCAPLYSYLFSRTRLSLPSPSAPVEGEDGPLVAFTPIHICPLTLLYIGHQDSGRIFVSYAHIVKHLPFSKEPRSTKRPVTTVLHRLYDILGTIYSFSASPFYLIPGTSDPYFCLPVSNSVLRHPKDDHAVPFRTVPSLWLSEHSGQLLINSFLNPRCLCDIDTHLPSVLTPVHLMLHPRSPLPRNSSRAGTVNIPRLD